MTKISAGTTLTSIVGTEVAPVYKSGQASGDKFVMPMNLVGPNAKSSEIYPTQVAYQMSGIETEGNGSLPLEFLNIGNPGFVPQGTETRNLVPAGIVRIGGNVLLVRNIEWDQANLRWLTPLQDADAYGSGILEMGGEGINFHVSPSAEHFYASNRMVFTNRAEGARGVPGYTSGQVNQALAPLFIHYATTSYQSGKLASWNPSSATSALIHLHSDELKGTAGTFDQNEFLRLETNSSTTTAFPGIVFKTSHGSYSSRSAIATNRDVGSISSVVFDGTTDQRTADIRFTTRGTISSGNAAQSIKFATSSTNTAGLTTRFEVMNDVVRGYQPFRFENSSITTIPDYSAFLTTSTPTTSTLWQMQQLSASTGGARHFGFSTTSTASTAIALAFSAILGANAPTAPAFLFQGLKHNGTTGATDLASTEIIGHFRNNSTVLIEILGSGNTGFGQTTPTAVVDLSAGTTTRASLRVREGVAPTSPNDGDIWKETTNDRLMFRMGATSKEILSSATVNSVSPTSPDRTIEVVINGTTYYIHAKTTND